MTSLKLRELLAFFAIYVIWGSTYLAIRYAVESIPPLLTAGVRHLVAGTILYAIAVWLRGERVHLSATQWRASFVVAALFFLIGHGSLHWAEQTVPSGVAALLVATEPLWIALLMPAAQGPHARLRTAGGLAAGLVGVALLVPREALTAGSQQVWGSSAILVGAMAWALGVRYASTAALPRDSLVRATTTLLCGAVLLLIASTATGEIGAARPARDLGALGARPRLPDRVRLRRRVLGLCVAARAPLGDPRRHAHVRQSSRRGVSRMAGGRELVTPRIIGATGLILAAVFLLKSDSSQRPAARLESPDLDTSDTSKVIRPVEESSIPVRRTT